MTSVGHDCDLRTSARAKFNVLLGCTGSVASLKVPELAEMLIRRGSGRIYVRVVCTERATHFFDTEHLEAILSKQETTNRLSEAECGDVKELESHSLVEKGNLLAPTEFNANMSITPSRENRTTTPPHSPEDCEGANLTPCSSVASENVATPFPPYSREEPSVPRWRDKHVFRDADEWSLWRRRGDPVLHIELRRWAHLLLVAPLGANCLAQLSHGMADSLLTCVARAWSVRDAPALLCPAMNTLMWEHPCTAQQLQVLSSWGWHVQQPVVKRLVCGDTGIGAMADIGDICDAVFRLLGIDSDPNV